ncbi:MAG: hypothetical protein H7X86_13630, partial [Gorillibacterium sp.]|nr:hypothetical protein [Gorillibacterium sp.]
VPTGTAPSPSVRAGIVAEPSVPTGTAPSPSVHPSTDKAELSPVSLSGEPDRRSTDIDYVQLSLFTTDADAKDNNSSRKTDVKLHQLADRLKNADLINMTPLAAMNFLFDLKQRLSDKG